MPRYDGPRGIYGSEWWWWWWGWLAGSDMRVLRVIIIISILLLQLSLQRIHAHTHTHTRILFIFFRPSRRRHHYHHHYHHHHMWVCRSAPSVLRFLARKPQRGRSFGLIVIINMSTSMLSLKSATNPLEKCSIYYTFTFFVD